MTDTLPLPPITDDLLDLLVEHTHRDLDDPDGCWTWESPLRRRRVTNRRPRTQVGDHHYLVARLWLSLEHPEIGPNDTTEHRCSTPWCVNPHHLSVLSVRDNVLADTSQGMGAMHARQTRCCRGHLAWRTYRDSKGRTHRQCRVCERARRTAR